MNWKRNVLRDLIECPAKSLDDILLSYNETRNQDTYAEVLSGMIDILTYKTYGKVSTGTGRIMDPFKTRLYEITEKINMLG